MAKIFYRDKVELDAKIQKIKEAGTHLLHVVSDFDRTLTKEYDNGRKVSTSIGLIRSEDHLPNGYSKKAWDLFEKYYPIESDHSLEEKYRKDMMLRWWKEHEKLLIESGMNRKIITDLLDNHPKAFRENTDQFFEMLHKNTVPLIIFSAGLGDVIEEQLRRIDRLTENINIVSNFIRFDNDGFMKGYKHDPIHIMNKSESSTKNIPQIQNRKNVILLGDNLNDTRMVDDGKNKNILRIGFLNKYIKDRIETYLENFDVVITDDGPMDEVNRILKEIMND